MAWPAEFPYYELPPRPHSFRRDPIGFFDSLREPAVRWIGGPGAGTAAV